MSPLYRKLSVLVIVLILTCSAASAKVLTLNDCIELALKNNQDVIRARGNVRVADGNVWQAFGAFLPSVDASASVTETHTPTGTSWIAVYDSVSGTFSAVPVGSGGVDKAYSLRASAAMTIFNGGRNIFNFIGANADKKYYDYTLEATEQNMIYSVKLYYFAYLRAVEQEKISQKAVKRGEEQYKLVDSKYKVGSASRSDVLKATVQYGNDKLDLIAAHNAVQVAHADLAYLIGVDVNSDTEFSSDFEARKYDGTEADAMKFGLANHPGLISNEYNLKAARYDVKTTFGRYLPSLGISLNRYWSNSQWSEFKKFRSEDGQWSISTTLSIPIFENFSRKQDMSRAKAVLNNARADYYYAKNKVVHDIRESYLDITRAEEALNVAKENVSAATEDMTLVQERYNLGAATILDLLDAQVSLITAENARNEAEFDYNLAVAKLENATGVR
jgi:outer membrane protein